MCRPPPTNRRRLRLSAQRQARQRWRGRRSVSEAATSTHLKRNCHHSRAAFGIQCWHADAESLVQPCEELPTHAVDNGFKAWRRWCRAEQLHQRRVSAVELDDWINKAVDEGLQGNASNGGKPCIVKRPEAVDISLGQSPRQEPLCPRRIGS
jgi:hypothetical protein